MRPRLPNAAFVKIWPRAARDLSALAVVALSGSARRDRRRRLVDLLVVDVVVEVRRDRALALVGRQQRRQASREACWPNVNQLATSGSPM